MYPAQSYALYVCLAVQREPPGGTVHVKAWSYMFAFEVMLPSAWGKRLAANDRTMDRVESGGTEITQEGVFLELAGTLLSNTIL